MKFLLKSSWRSNKIYYYKDIFCLLVLILPQKFEPKYDQVEPKELELLASCSKSTYWWNTWDDNHNSSWNLQLSIHEWKIQRNPYLYFFRNKVVLRPFIFKCAGFEWKLGRSDALVIGTLNWIFKIETEMEIGSHVSLAHQWISIVVKYWRKPLARTGCACITSLITLNRSERESVSRPGSGNARICSISFHRTLMCNDTTGHGWTSLSKVLYWNCVLDNVMDFHDKKHIHNFNHCKKVHTKGIVFYAVFMYILIYDASFLLQLIG